MCLGDVIKLSQRVSGPVKKVKHYRMTGDDKYTFVTDVFNFKSIVTCPKSRYNRTIVSFNSSSF